MSKKKYELADETQTLLDGTVLHRIRALRDIPRSNVKAGDIGGWVESERNLSQEGDAWVGGNARVCGNAVVCGNAEVCDDALVCGCAMVRGNALVCGYAMVRGNALVSGSADVCGNVQVFDNARVGGNVCVGNGTSVCGDAKISHSSDYMTIKNAWSSNRVFTYTRSNRKWCVGCFSGSGEELIAKAYKDGELSGKCYEATVKYVEGIYAAIEAAKAKKKK